MKKPLIGITLDNEDKGGYSKFPWYAIRHNYLHSIEKYGGIPLPLYHSNKNTSELFNILNGLVITGGNFDIDPKIYGNRSSGARILTTLLTALDKKNKNIGLATLCIGGGEASAMIIEKL